MREGRLSAQFWSIYTDCKTNFKDGVDWALEQIDITERMIQSYSEFVYVSKYIRHTILYLRIGCFIKVVFCQSCLPDCL